MALPKHIPLGDSQRIDDAAVRAAVGMPADLQARVHAASAKVQVQEAGKPYNGSGITLLSGPNGSWLGSAAHLTYGTRNPSDVTVIDANGNSHKPDAGCYVYETNGEAVPLDAHATQPNDNVVDDLLILHIPSPMPGSLPIRTGAAPEYGESIYFGGYPLQNGKQGAEVYSKACLEVFSRDDVSSAACASAQPPGEGASGSGMVTGIGEVVGILNGYEAMAGPVWGANGHIADGAPYSKVDYTGQRLLQAALVAATDQYAR